MKSPYFNEEHQLFRDSLRAFIQTEFQPYFAEWEKENAIPRWAWKKMGEMGYLGICHEEEYGGLDADMFYQVVFNEELSRSLNTGFAISVAVHVYMATNHIAHAGNSFQKEKYLAPAIAGDMVAALGMSEPAVGSNVKGLKTFAEDKGDHYLVNGSKIFITNGYYADFMTLVADTAKGISLLIVDLDAEGVSRNKLEKIGWHSSDTAEVFFQDVKVPKENLLGEEGQGFYFLSESLQMERLVLAMNSIGLMDGTLELTQQYMSEREAFGKPISKFQALRHRLADIASELEATRQLVYHTAWLLENGEFAVKECSMAKLLSAELHKKLVDECLQMFGGYGYMEEFPIAQVYRDARAASIVGGTSEIMREIIAKMMFEGVKYNRAYSK
ncbi:MAG: acyl-CoA dehydrogenase family protein [Bacteroidia bacterium]|nr:acyl-CoA dehydrogenase family protein [Bacteroidia bacterium]